MYTRQAERIINANNESSKELAFYSLECMLQMYTVQDEHKMAHAHADTYATPVTVERTRYTSGKTVITLRCGVTRIVVEVDEAAELTAQLGKMVALINAETTEA